MTEAASNPKHVFLIDGSGFLFRAYHGLPPMSRADGTPVNAVFGFTKMLMKLVEDTDADHIAVVFDRARKTFRNEIYGEYKAHRPPPPDDLIPQFALVREATRALNIAEVGMEGYEADDLIATYARQAREIGAEVTIVSSDKDLMQLVGDGVTMLDAMKNKTIGPDQVMEKFGVGPDRVIDVQALAGDSSDNVPGVAGIGVKTAALLINEYGDLDQVLARAEEVKQPKRRQSLLDQADLARVSRELVTLMQDVPVEMPLSDFAAKDIEPETLIKFLEAQNFKSMVTTIKSRFGVEGAAEDVVEAPVESRYELVQTVAALEAWVARATEAGWVAVDTETTSLNSMRAELVGVSLSIDPGHACYIPLAHKQALEQGTLDLGGEGSGDGDEALEQIPVDQALAILKPMLEDPATLKIGQNIKYDMQIFAKVGVFVAPVDDTMVLSYVLEGGMHGHGMDELAQLHLDRTTVKFKEVVGSGKSQITFDYVPLEKALGYAAEDADITAQLHRAMKSRLATEHMTTVYETLERPLIPVLEAMERTG
ncbi:MAG: DNA polymerase I, partial [Rhodospirillales bacterium]|nr:DNA polymerase I [Rhodospirillales bacterium]